VLIKKIKRKTKKKPENIEIMPQLIIRNSASKVKIGEKSMEEFEIK
jgi:hypothetical protein